MALADSVSMLSTTICGNSRSVSAAARQSRRHKFERDGASRPVLGTQRSIANGRHASIVMAYILVAISFPKSGRSAALSAACTATVSPSSINASPAS